jgi:hypothetical protein
MAIYIQEENQCDTGKLFMQSNIKFVLFLKY